MKLEAFSIAGVSLFSRLSRFLIVPILAVSMAPDELGRYELLMASLLVFEMVIILKMPEAMFRLYFDYEIGEKVYASALQLAFFSCVVCSVILVMLTYLWGGFPRDWVLVGCIVTPKIIGLVSAEYHRARKEFMSYFLISSIPGIFFLLWIVAIYSIEGRIHFADILIGLFCANVLMLVTTVSLSPLPRSRPLLFRTPNSGELYKILLVFGLGLLPSAVAWWAMRLSNRWIASDLYGLEVVGWLGVANYLPMILTAVGAVLYTASQRYVYSRGENLSANNEGVKYAFRLYVFSQVICIVLLMCFEWGLERLGFFSEYGEMSLFVLAGLIGIGMLNLGSFLGALQSAQYSMFHLSVTAIFASGMCVFSTYFIMLYYGVEYFGLPIIVSGICLVVFRVLLLARSDVRCVGRSVWGDSLLYFLVLIGLATGEIVFYGVSLGALVYLGYARGFIKVLMSMGRSG